ncbi:hypothetical protein EDD85DRAFT_167156 [Armillaria nabsnona]|nr:hypothetical protein EDD85DRAFT_167156 [Armillaria nabsnona]
MRHVLCSYTALSTSSVAMFLASNLNIFELYLTHSRLAALVIIHQHVRADSVMYPWRLPLSQLHAILWRRPRVVSWKFQDAVDHGTCFTHRRAFPTLFDSGMVQASDHTCPGPFRLGLGNKDHLRPTPFLGNATVDSVSRNLNLVLRSHLRPAVMVTTTCSAF